MKEEVKEQTQYWIAALREQESIIEELEKKIRGLESLIKTLDSIADENEKIIQKQFNYINYELLPRINQLEKLLANPIVIH